VIAWLPVASLAALMALMCLRGWVKRFLKRRRTPPPPETLLEKRVAVGSLTGVAPADIEAHVLLVLEEGGRVVITGTGCDALRGFMLAHASAAHAAAAWQAHDHGHGGES
jgi:hypothetical protein